MRKNQLLICAVFAFALALCSCKKQQAEDTRAKINIRTEPAGATVFIDHKNKVNTPTPCAFPIRAGSYIIEISSPGYQTSWQRISCKQKENVDINLSLEPISASVLVNSTPEQATVSIDEKIIGQTPLVLHKQEIGEHSVTVSKPGFSPKQISWTVEDSRPIKVNADLLSNTGRLRVSSTPENANLFIDENPRGQTPLTVTLEQGTHKIRIEMTGYAEHEQNVVITRDQTSSIDATMQILPASLSVDSEPSGASLFINDQQYENTPAKIPNLQPGEYSLRVEKEGFDSASRDVTLPPGQEISVTLRMDSNMGGIDLVVHPPGITVYVDGKKIGVTKEGETPSLSEVMEIRNLTSGNHRITLAHKRAKPNPEITFQVRIRKGEISRPRPITMWIEDIYIRLKTGVILRGRIRQENDDEILFEHTPNIVQRYDRDEIDIMRPLDADE